MARRRGRNPFTWSPTETEDALVDCPDPAGPPAPDNVPRGLCLPVESHEDMDFDPADDELSERPDPLDVPRPKPAAPAPTSSYEPRIPKDAKVTLRLPLALTKTNPQTELFGSLVDGGDAPVLSAASRAPASPVAAAGPPGSKYAPARRYFRGPSVTVRPPSG
jgi:hypothetical protein